jgi:hypothetical protein
MTQLVEYLSNKFKAKFKSKYHSHTHAGRHAIGTQWTYALRREGRRGYLKEQSQF